MQPRPRLFVETVRSGKSRFYLRISIPFDLVPEQLQQLNYQLTDSRIAFAQVLEHAVANRPAQRQRVA